MRCFWFGEGDDQRDWEEMGSVDEDVGCSTTVVAVWPVVGSEMSWTILAESVLVGRVGVCIFK